MNNSARLLTLAKEAFRQAARNSSSEQVVEKVNPRFYRVKKLQQKFGLDDGTLVHLKGGFMDRITYKLTFGLTLVSVGFGCHTLYKLAFKD